MYTPGREYLYARLRSIGTKRYEISGLNLTQAALAEAINISDTYMGAIERGVRSLALDTLVRLGVTVDYMLVDSVSDSDFNIVT